MAGAMDVQMDWIQLGPGPARMRRASDSPPLLRAARGLRPHGRSQNGQALFQETGNRKERADAIILIGHPVVILGDSYAVPKQVFPKHWPRAGIGSIKN